MSIDLTQCIPFQNSVETYLQTKLDPFHQKHIEVFVFIVEEKIKKIFESWWGEIQKEAARGKFSYTSPNHAYDIEGCELISQLFLQTYGVYARFQPHNCVSNHAFLPMLGYVGAHPILFEWHPFNPQLYPQKEHLDKYRLEPSQHNQSYWLSAVKGEGTDVVFKVAGVNIAAHKFILNRSALSSDPFRAQIESGAKMGNRKEIEIGDCRQETFKEVLEFIYTGEIPLSLSYIELFKLAHRFALQKLCDHCEDQLMKNLSERGVEESAFKDLMLLATLYDVNNLLLPCLQFANSSADKVDLTSCPPDSLPKMFTLAVKHSLNCISKHLGEEIIARMQF